MSPELFGVGLVKINNSEGLLIDALVAWAALGLHIVVRVVLVVCALKIGVEEELASIIFELNGAKGGEFGAELA